MAHAYSPWLPLHCPPHFPPGILLALACFGPLALITGSRVRRVGALACLVCSAGPLLGAALLVVGPSAYARPDGSGHALPGSGGATPASAAALAFSGAGEKLTAAAAGWCWHAGAALLLPQARAWAPRRAWAGAAVGAALVAGGGALAAALCAGTPYCLTLRVQKVQ
jgi:hypothetical protein